MNILAGGREAFSPAQSFCPWSSCSLPSIRRCRVLLVTPLHRDRMIASEEGRADGFGPWGQLPARGCKDAGEGRSEKAALQPEATTPTTITIATTARANSHPQQRQHRAHHAQLASASGVGRHSSDAHHQMLTVTRNITLSAAPTHSPTHSPLDRDFPFNLLSSFHQLLGLAKNI